MEYENIRQQRVFLRAEAFGLRAKKIDAEIEGEKPDEILIAKLAEKEADEERLQIRSLALERKYGKYWVERGYKIRP